MQLVLDTKGLEVIKKDGVFHIKGEKGSKAISPAKLDSIAITASVMISSDAIALAIQHQVPILVFDRIGKAKARLWSPYFESIATLRRHQVRFAESPESMAWMLELFALKTEAQIENLRYLKSRRSARGPRVVTPRGSSRDNRPRSADATVTASPLAVWSRHCATTSSSPTPGACTVVTPATSPSGTPAPALPSSTRTTQSNDRSAFWSPAWSLAAAPARSRHQPSGTEPTTFAPSTTKTFTGRSFHLILHTRSG